MSQKRHNNHRSYGYVLILLITACAALAGRFFVAVPYRIPTGSMNPTLLEGDYIGVDRIFWRIPMSSRLRRGDIILFKEVDAPDTVYVKRIIGLPNDHIRLDNRQIFINGEPLPLDKLDKVTFESEYFDETIDGKRRLVMFDKGEWRNEGHFWTSHKEGFVVPDGHYFVMGDNRDHSMDSREWGTLPAENIVGRAFLIWFSTDYANDKIRWGRLLKIF